MITEAYTSIENTMKYYGDETKPGAHFSFNFGLITNLNDSSKAAAFNDTINEWLSNMPNGKWANWVVSFRYGWNMACMCTNAIILVKNNLKSFRDTFRSNNNSEKEYNNKQYTSFVQFTRQQS